MSKLHPVMILIIKLKNNNKSVTLLSKIYTLKQTIISSSVLSRYRKTTHTDWKHSEILLLLSSFLFPIRQLTFYPSWVQWDKSPPKPTRPLSFITPRILLLAHILSMGESAHYLSDNLAVSSRAVQSLPLEIPRGRRCVWYVVVTVGAGLEAAVSRPTDQALWPVCLPGPTVCFHEGINVYFNMPPVLF